MRKDEIGNGEEREEDMILCGIIEGRLNKLNRGDSDRNRVE
jgi:hypothetical protein